MTQGRGNIKNISPREKKNLEIMGGHEVRKKRSLWTWMSQQCPNLRPSGTFFEEVPAILAGNRELIIIILKRHRGNKRPSRTSASWEMGFSRGRSLILPIPIVQFHTGTIER
jgi:hypothetical protein